MSGKRGILGVKRDPRRQVLFRLNGDEWPTSDSEDTDYEPGKSWSDLEAESSDEGRSGSGRKLVKKRKARQKRSPVKIRKMTDTPRPTRPRRRRVQRSAAKEDGEGEEAGPPAVSSGSSADPLLPGTPVPRLPMELWLRIFQFVVDAHGALPFLCRAAKVCQEWSELSCLPCLWWRLDLSFGWIKSTDATLKWLATHRLSQCREINLSRWKSLTNSAVKVLAEKCPSLEVIDLSHCQKLSSDTVRVLADGCPKIRSLDMSQTSPCATTAGSLKYFVSQVGPSLKELYLAQNEQICFGPALKAIMTHCRHLETLDLSGTWVHLVVKVEELQDSLPCLRVLGLGNCSLRSAVDDLVCEGAGFPNLEELSCCMTQTNYHLNQRGIPDSMLIRLLHKAEGLRMLDLRGCVDMDPWRSVLTIPTESSPIRDLEKLYLGRSSMAGHCMALARMLQQWAHSLRVLDLSWITTMLPILDTAFGVLTLAPSPFPLTDLNMTGSSVTLVGLKIILEIYPNLHSLDLSSCKALPRGLKSAYVGAEALRKLRDTVRGLASSTTDSSSH